MRRKKVRRRGKARNTRKSKDVVISKDMSRIIAWISEVVKDDQCSGGWWRE